MKKIRIFKGVLVITSLIVAITIYSYVNSREYEEYSHPFRYVTINYCKAITNFTDKNCYYLEIKMTNASSFGIYPVLEIEFKNNDDITCGRLVVRNYLGSLSGRRNNVYYVDVECKDIPENANWSKSRIHLKEVNYISRDPCFLVWYKRIIN